MSTLESLLERILATSGSHADADHVPSRDPQAISWNRNLEKTFEQRRRLEPKQNTVREGAYRPFAKQHLCFDRQFNAMTY